MGVASDIQPTRRGHVIVAPKVHVKLLSELPEKHAAALGKALVKVSKAISLGVFSPAQDWISEVLIK